MAGKRGAKMTSRERFEMLQSASIARIQALHDAVKALEPVKDMSKLRYVHEDLLHLQRFLAEEWEAEK